MKILCRVLLVIFFLNSILFHTHAETKNVASSIKSVTVYGDRALVSRTASASLQAGNHVIVFPNIPLNIDDRSVKISGEAMSAKIVDVRVETSFLDTIPEERIKVLQQKIEELQSHINALNDQMRDMYNEREFLNQIKIQSADNIGKELKVQRPTIDDWQKILLFLKQNHNRISVEYRDEEKKRNAMQHALDAAQRQLNAINPNARRAAKNIVVEIEVAKASDVKFVATYVVFGTRWFPQYDVRVAREANEVQLEYRGMVQQSTGEDWTNVDLALSTARPDVGGVKPELYRWYVNFAEADIAQRERMEKFGNVVTAERPMINKSTTSAVTIATQTEMAAVGAMEEPTAAVESQATSVLFNIPTKATIPSDNVAHKVTIGIEKLAAEFSYASTPKLSPFVFLKAKVKNTTELPLLAGAMNVFTEKEYVSQSSIKTILPNETFDAYLGVDQSIKIERKFINKTTEYTGTFSKNNKVVYEFSYTLENTKKNDVTVVVSDHLPLSQNEKIVVEQIEPSEKELKKNERGELLWSISLKPSEKKNWKLKFSIEYPQGANIIGIE